MTDRIDFDQVREVIRIAQESGVADLEVETPALKVRVRRDAAGAPGTSTPAAPGGAALSVPAASPPAAAEGADEDRLIPIIAPMVGTFYRASSPNAPPFVKEGDHVGEGQVVCIIEAMKLFNEIQAETPGRVARVLVDNASPVEYGQPLFLLDATARG